MPKKIESTEAAVRLAVAVAIQAARDIREAATILRRQNLTESDVEYLKELELELAVDYFDSPNGLWAATRAAFDCDEVDPLPGFQRDLALVRRWVDARRRQREAQADVSAHRG